ncbi:MAG: hypothetical protein JWO38_634 [Gemmataceae bacterium]|nr:hypothetical protein [Gemmataceae bacterium]
MPGRLTPTTLDALGGEIDPPPVGGYATLSKERVLRLARAMPDAQSAVVLLLAWQATLHEKMKRGRLAGRAAASLSGGQLSEMTRRPLRTIRHALRQLLRVRRIAKEPTAAGRKNTYVLPFLSGQDA